MKRIIDTEETVKQKSNIKPLYNSFSRTNKEIAYYDPTDTHVHIYTTDFLKTEQNHMEQTYRFNEDKNKSNEDTYCTYCTICHEIKHDIILSRSNVRSIPSLDLIKNNNLSKEIEYTYYDIPRINNLKKNEKEIEIETNEKKQEKEKDKGQDERRSKLFIPRENIINNYVKIVDG